MQYVEGKTLAARMREKLLELSESLTLAAQVVDAFGSGPQDSTPLASGKAQLEHWRFESWIQPDIQSIAQTVQTLLNQCALKPTDVDSVFLTGGSSFVPYVRRYFSKTFGPTKLRSGEELTTVAKGLALRALEE